MLTNTDISNLLKSQDNSTEEPNKIRIPLSQKVVRGIDLHRQLRDPAFEADRTRLIPIADLPISDERLTKTAEMTVEVHGGSIRKFTGNLAHENGWWFSIKRNRVQFWEGMAQREAILAAECNFSVLCSQSEPCLIRAQFGDRWFEWYADLWLQRLDGPDELWEIKRDEKQLEDLDYRLKMAVMDEVCRRIGIRFRLVMRDEIVKNRHHRNNLELFASRRFVHIAPVYIHRFEAFAINRGFETTYGELSHAIDPLFPLKGAAVIQGLTAKRRVEIDLTRMLSPNTALRIH